MPSVAIIARSALILSLKPLLAMVSSWAMGGECYNTPRSITPINPVSKDTKFVNTYEVLHLHYSVQLWNRSARTPDVCLRHGSPGQETGPHQRPRQRLQLFPQ